MRCMCRVRRTDGCAPGRGRVRQTVDLLFEDLGGDLTEPQPNPGLLGGHSRRFRGVRDRSTPNSCRGVAAPRTVKTGQ